jgi:trigger factor
LKRENLADLRKYVGELLNENYARMAEDLMRDSLFDELLKVKVELPEGLVERDLDVLMSEQKGDEKTLEKKRKELRKESEDRTKLGLVIADLGERAGITVEEAELKQAIISEAMKYRGQEQKVIEWYSRDPNAAAPLRARIFEDKTVRHLLTKVGTKEKPVKPAELMKKG